MHTSVTGLDASPAVSQHVNEQEAGIERELRFKTRHFDMGYSYPMSS